MSRLNLMKWEMRKQIRMISSRVARLYTMNIEQQLQMNALISTTEYVETHLSNITSFAGRFDLLHYALKEVTLKGLHLEFGVHRAASINFLAKRIDTTIHGFDSFEGLPEFWRDGFIKNHFAVNRLPKVHSNVMLYQGWFDNTLPNFLKNLSEKEVVAFLHIDSDLYSSAKTIFDQLSSRITSGTVILFDEYFNYPHWKNGEYKAFQEFIQNKGLSYQYIGFNRFGEQVAVIIC
jgi:hypothetical protein